MKHEVKANKAVNTRIGDVVIEAEAGKTIALSAREAEIAMSTGDFEYVGEKAESKREERELSEQPPQETSTEAETTPATTTQEVAPATTKAATAAAKAKAETKV